MNNCLIMMVFELKLSVTIIILDHSCLVPIRKKRHAVLNGSVDEAKTQHMACNDGDSSYP